MSERDTSKTCCVCGTEDESQRVERGLYVCKEHDGDGDAFNADVNGAENIRLDINDESNSESAPDLGGDRSTGWLAQPGVYLHDLSRGFQPRTEVGDCKPSYPNPTQRCGAVGFLRVHAEEDVNRGLGVVCLAIALFITYQTYA